MITVKDILAGKPPATNYIEPSALVADALKLLTSVNLSYLIVMDEEDFKGLFTERDYARNVFLKGRTSNDTLVQEVMCSDLPKVDLSATVEDCMNKMNMHRTRYVLAFNNNDFEGVITIHDLMRQIIANREEVFDQNLTNAFIDNDESGLIY